MTTTASTVLPTNLLHACCLATDVKGGTIHQFLPSLAWRKMYGASAQGLGACYSLDLAGKSIGWIQCRRPELPAIEPSMAIAWARW